MKKIKTVKYESYAKAKKEIRESLVELLVENGLGVGSVDILFKNARSSVEPYLYTVEEIDRMNLRQIKTFATVLKKATKLANSFRYAGYKVTNWND